MSYSTVIGTSILHVEDEDASAFLLQAALDQAAIPNPIYRVSSGEKALAFLCKTGPYASAQTPALVILDLHLPRMDGWAVLTTMKRHPELCKIPVVILTSSQVEADRVRSAELGAARYVFKQPSIAALRKELVRCCAPYLSFYPAAETAPSYVLRTSLIAFERVLDNGVEMNLATVLQPGIEVTLTRTEVADSAAHFRYQDRELWISLQDLRNNAVPAAQAAAPGR